jgi:hypothetical protein
MKSRSLFLACVLAIGTTGTFAADAPMNLPVKAPMTVPPTSGFASLYFGGSWSSQTEGGMQHDTGRVVGGDARVNWWYSRSNSVQLDVEGEYAGNLEGCCVTKYRWYAAMDAHFAVRDPSSHAYGILLGLVKANNLDDGNRANYGLIGVEAQRYIGNTTYYGQAGYLHLFNGDEDAEKTGFARGVLRHFTDPNTKLAAELGYARGRLHDNTDNKIKFLTWGASAERKLPSSPASVFLAYTGARVKSTDNPGDRAMDHTVMLGFRVYSNQATLLSNDRTGATFDKPTFLKYLPWVGEAD